MTNTNRTAAAIARQAVALARTLRRAGRHQEALRVVDQAADAVAALRAG